MARNQAIFLMGPTAVGKTELALCLAQHYKIEIVSVDSALIYRDLNIGSAKPDLAELNLVPHHLIDILSPLESYSVADFLRDCNQLIQAVNQRGNIPLLVGGTMMYYKALMHGISQLPASDPLVRAQLAEELIKYGNQVLYERLVQLDPVIASKIEVNDSQRLQRALEVCILADTSMSKVQEESKLEGLVNCDYLALAVIPHNRKLLHERINQRSIQMLEKGFVEEVIALRQKYPLLTGQHNSMRCVGYRQIWDYLDGRISYNLMLEQSQAATRQLAKRQLTWLRSLQVIAVDEPNLDLTILKAQVVNHIDKYLRACSR